MLTNYLKDEFIMGPSGAGPAQVEIKVPEKVKSNANMTVTPTVEVTEIEVPEPYKTPQPDIPAGTRIRMFPKNFRNQPCGCHSGKKFKKCCIDQVKSEHLYKVPSAEMRKQ